MTVAVVVDKTAPRAPSMPAVAQASQLGYVSKSAVAIIAIKEILTPSGNEDVLEAIVVVVADADAAAPTVVDESGAFGYIGEGAITVVVVQAIGRGRRTRPKRVA